MTNVTRAPMLKIPLGLSPSLGITYSKLLERSRKRLRLLHSGQKKVDYLVQGDYLHGARLTVENDEFVLLAPILGPVQGDLLGYPNGASSFAALDDSELQAYASGAAANLSSNNDQGGNFDGAELDLGALLDAVTADEIGLAGDARQLASSRPAPVEADRLAVDQLLACAEASAEMLGALVEIAATSDDVIADTRRLERLTGLSSAPGRHFIAAREPELVADIDGNRVPFCAPPVRIDAVAKDVVHVQVYLLQTRSENDILRSEVIDADGTGVPGGVATLGEHDIRFVGLKDWQRGALLILRGAGVPLKLSVTEAISAARLARRPALVVDPGDWLALRRTAMEVLAACDAPVRCADAIDKEMGVASESDLGREAA